MAFLRVCLQAGFYWKSHLRLYRRRVDNDSCRMHFAVSQQVQFRHFPMHINPHRVIERLSDLACIGALSGGGVQRLAFSDDDLRGRNWVHEHLDKLGLEVRIDAIGNLFGILPGTNNGTAPGIMFGSHTDTVGRAGRLDGALGVVAALEVLEVISASDWRPAHPLILASFVNEEGVRYMPDMMGSLFHAGSLALETALESKDALGVRVADEMDRLEFAGTDTLDDLDIDTFVELHIEQGPVLESRGKDIGIVTGVQGLSWFEVTVEGASNHAGTTPMDMRRDAGVTAGKLCSALRQMPDDMEGLRLTIGAMHWHPNLVNVIPDRVVFTIDVRHPVQDVLQEAEERIKNILAADSHGLDVSWRSLARVDPCTFSPRVVDSVASAAGRNGLSGHRMISGAGHDAHILSRCYDAGMIFIPSRRGISHHPDEFSSDEQILSGTHVLLDTILTLAGYPTTTP